MGRHRDKKGAKGSVLSHFNVGVRAGEHRRIVIHVPQVNGDPGGVEVGDVLPPTETLRKRRKQGILKEQFERLLLDTLKERGSCR